MQKITYLFSVFSFFIVSMFFSVVALPAPALAAGENVGIPCENIKTETGNTIRPPCTKVENLGKLLGRVVAIIFIVAALLAFVFLLIGGLRWILSGGDKEGTAKARSTITAAIIGLAIVFLSFVVITILGRIFGFDIFNIQLPDLSIP